VVWEEWITKRKKERARSDKLWPLELSPRKLEELSGS
jgi:hypothetical protein